MITFIKHLLSGSERFQEADKRYQEGLRRLEEHERELEELLRKLRQATDVTHPQVGYLLDTEEELADQLRILLLDDDESDLRDSEHAKDIEDFHD